MKTVDELRSEIRRGLANMSAMSVLHLKSINSIEWSTDGGDSGWIKRTELNDGVVQLDAKRPSGRTGAAFFGFASHMPKAPPCTLT